MARASPAAASPLLQLSFKEEMVQTLAPPEPGAEHTGVPGPSGDEQRAQLEDAESAAA